MLQCHTVLVLGLLLFLLPASSQLDLLDELHGGLCLSFEITVAVMGEEELFAPDM